ncbi:isochorismatase family protein [bacterium]|nr:isochorismatase family protein [bacterium]
MPDATDLRAGDGVLVVDVQNDFCPGGALPVPDGDAVVPLLNAWMAAAAEHERPVYVSRDWHPGTHPSFEAQGGPWPPHCLQDTAGAAFHPDLAVPTGARIVTKGVRFDEDQYSAFDRTGLAAQLARDGVGRLFVGGLALDVCVHASVMGAREAGIEVVVIEDATRAIDDDRAREAREEMAGAGAVIARAG